LLEVTKGLVIRETAVGEKDKLLTVLTHDLGIITVSAKGIRSVKNPNIASAQLFCYSNFVLYKKGDYFWLRESDLIDNFYGIHSDLEKYALAAYLCSIAEEFGCVDEDAAEIERLLLNSLYAIANDRAPMPIIKGSFEMKIASVSGFMPDLSGCIECFCDSDAYMIFDVMNGCLLCRKCKKKLSDAEYLVRDVTIDTYESLEPVIKKVISSSTLAALRYVVDSRCERLFSFKLEDEALVEFSDVCEKYLLHHIGHGFSTLEFYKSVKS